MMSFHCLLNLLGCELITKAQESFHDVKLSDRSLIWLVSFSLEVVICSLYSVFLLIRHHSHWFVQEFGLDRDHRIRKFANKCMHNHVFS
jgi:hypothetical protein